MDGMPDVVKGKLGSFSVRAEDGRYYWVTLPTSARCAAHKAFASLLARACGATCADSTQIVIRAGLAQELLGRGCGSAEQLASQAGVHYGSMYPVDPKCQAIYDLLPAKMAGLVRNREQFALARALDLWLGNSDPAHAVYVRQPERDFIAWMIGFGQSFGFKAPQRGLYAHERALLDTQDSWDQTMRGAARIISISTSTMSHLASEVPSVWWAEAGRQPAELIEQLVHRQGTWLAKLSAMRLSAEAPRNCEREHGIAGTNLTRQRSCGL